MRALNILLIFVMFSCAGITPLTGNDWRKHYSEDFLQIVEKVIELRENGLWENAIELIMTQDEVNLSSTEKAFRRNLIGVHFLNNKNFEKAIFHFSQAVSFEIEDFKLLATVHLNLANANFQLGLFEESLKNLSMVDHNFLSQEGKKSYYLLNFEIANYIDDKDLQFNSLVGFVTYFGDSKYEDYIDNLRAFEILIKTKDLQLQNSIAEKFLENINAQSFKYILDIVERSYFGSKIDEAKRLITRLDESSWIQDNALEKIREFKERLGAFSEVDIKAIGVVLPLSGKYKKFGVRILRGIHSAFSESLATQGYRLIVQDSKSSQAIGKQAIKKLIKKYKVSSIIGGIESSFATTYFEEINKYQVLFISLAKVVSSPERKSRLLVEIPGSIESEVRSVLEKMSGQFPNSKAAIIFPKNGMGKNYFELFWSMSSSFGIKVVDAVSFDPSKKDLRDPIKDLLGLKYQRERIEELEILKQVYSLEKSVIRRVQNLKPLINFDWVFIPSAPYSAAQIIPSFSYFDATNEILIGPSSWKSSVINEVSRGKKGVNFNFGKSSTNESDVMFRETYGYSPKLPESRGRNSIYFLKELFKNIDSLTIESREDFLRSIVLEDKINLESATFNLINGSWNLSFEIGHFRGGQLRNGIRYVSKEKKEGLEEEKK